MLFQDPVESFLKYFNEIDKHFDIVLDQDKFSPFNEKLKDIGNGDYAISSYIKKNKKILKHMGELRNELIHGGKVGGKSLVTPTKETISELKKHKVVICNPPSVGKIFHNENIITMKEGEKDKETDKSDKVRKSQTYNLSDQLSDSSDLSVKKPLNTASSTPLIRGLQRVAEKEFLKQYYFPVLNSNGEIVDIISLLDIISTQNNVNKDYIYQRNTAKNNRHCEKFFTTKQSCENIEKTGSPHSRGGRNKGIKKTSKKDFFGDKSITYKVVSESFLLLEVQHFYQHCAKKRLQGVLVITKNGKPEEKIEGLISPFNYGKIFKYL